jgi:hypothetical protein
MKHRIKRANTTQPRVALYGSPQPVDVNLLIEYLDELSWHYKNNQHNTSRITAAFTGEPK